MAVEKKLENLNVGPESSNEEGWDPAHLAATIVIFVAAIGLLFWLFWALMVSKSLMANIVAGVILLILSAEIIYVFKK